MATSIISLHDDFKKHFGITDIHWSKDSGGQKYVHCITRNKEQCILKIYRNFNSRDIREIEIYKKFHSIPDIPKIKEVATYEKDTVSFEELIEGKCLEEIMMSYKGNEKMIAELLTGICQVMIPLWESKEQIVHRDIKPSNLIIRPNGKPVVIDFGIAKDSLASTVTSTSFQPNSWPFAAPEQYESRKDDIQYRTDFFSIAALGYYLYYGNLPYGMNQAEIATNFKDKSFIVKHHSPCKLNPFFKDALGISIAERPRTSEEMLKLLSV
jgi:serine/threonine protein kinase